MQRDDRFRKGDAGKIVIGCAVVAVVALLICGGLFTYYIPKMMKQAGEAIQNEIVREQFADDWNPPAEDVTTEELFPEMVGEYTRQAQPDETTLSQFGIEDPSQHARYSGPATEVDVYVMQVERQIKNAYFITLKDTIENGNFTSQSTFKMQDRFYFQVSPPEQTGWFWWKDGWMITVISPSNEDPEPFLTKYLLQISGPEPVVPEVEDAPESVTPTAAADADGEAKPTEDAPETASDNAEAKPETPAAPEASEPAEKTTDSPPSDN